jgi:hypothetical protein
MRAIKFALVVIAYAGIFIGMVAASALVARVVRAQVSFPHRSEMSVPNHGEYVARPSGRAISAAIGQS